MEVFDRPTFLRIAGEGMNYGEVLPRSRRNRDAWDAFGGRRKRREEREGQMADCIAKLGTVRAIPGIDGIEAFQAGDASAFDNAEQIEPGIGNRACAVGEADQGKHRAGNPDFGVIGTGGFERGQGQNHVANGAWAN